ncbi:fibronectin type III domain-containing protein [Paenibacillus sp. LPE1-1-1.1]|uniref:fibronectin type III domain-containing protein n=1 Tax=Paenibacillus sp. LPE1-1-1.1 TaxID=3135230 RepID=UPI003425C7B1
MTYDASKPLKKAGNQPAPQYWNEDIGDWDIVKGSGGAYRMQAPVEVAEETFSSSGSLTKEFTAEMDGIVIVNDGTVDLTLSVHGKSRVVKAGESYSGRFRPFTSVIVTSTGPWRAEALQSYVAAPVITQPSDTIAPSNVTNLVASNVVETGLTLTWTAATDNVAVTGYDVYRGASLVGSVTGTTFNATGLTQATQYTYTVKAKDAAGNASSGTPITVTTAATPVDTTPPSNVTNVTTTNLTHNSLTVSWSVSSSSDVASYEVYQGATLLGTVTGTQYNVTGLTPSTLYTFTVKARDASANVATGASVTVSTNAQPADVTPPANVTNLASSALTQTGVTLTWTASVASDIKDYRVYNGATLITTVTGTTYNVTGLTASTAYTFTVKARDTSDNEATGALVNVTTSAAADTTAPNPVTGLTAGTPTETTVPLTWTLSSSGDVVAQEVAYSTDGTNFTVASAVVNASSTTYTVTGRTASTLYTFRLVAIDGAGNRSTAVTVTATTAAAAAPSGPVADASRTYFAENVSNGTVIANPENYFSGTGDFTAVITFDPTMNGANAANTLLARWVVGGTDNVVKLEWQFDNKIAGTLYGTKADGTTAWNPSVVTGVYADLAKFYHIVFEREGTTIKLYVDDVMIHSATILTSDIVRTTSAQSLTVGKTGQLGVFKNVSYYNRALTALERTQNYNALK